MRIIDPGGAQGEKIATKMQKLLTETVPIRFLKKTPNGSLRAPASAALHLAAAFVP